MHNTELFKKTKCKSLVTQFTKCFHQRKSTVLQSSSCILVGNNYSLSTQSLYSTFVGTECSLTKDYGTYVQEMLYIFAFV